ncbi:hypothetical protein [Vibrio palustris]|uniref:hypothetical protein n=1 Tax=Vibrio palustris TaxID=1918946 RepID=UPI0013566EB9|nr:hypothetical protein [Vibrio palustris]
MNILKNHSFTKFISVGLINTISTIFIYQLLLFFIPAVYSYSISWLLGFIFILLFYPKYVFEVGLSKNTIAVTGLVYLISLFIGAFLTQHLVYEKLDKRFVIFIVLIVTTIFNYVMLRVFLKRLNNVKERN